jgi:ribosomal protein S12 methylthiotransferase
MPPKRRVALVPLGCPKNLVDSEVLLGALDEAGYEVGVDQHEADVVIVNTCAFIDAAQEEAVEALLDLAELKTHGQCKALIVAGCLSRRFGEELFDELPEIDGVIGPGDLAQIADVVQRALAGRRPVEIDGHGEDEAQLPRWAPGPTASRYVKLAEGCDHSCAFCTIPDLRGPYRSRPSDQVVQECRTIAEAGVKEIVLVAQDTSAYGLDLQPQESLSRLLHALRSLPLDGWIRLMYLHPDRVDEQLIETIGEHMQVVNYFDIPLQHSSPGVLKAMHRAGSAEEYLALVTRIRRLIPDAAVRTTFLLGYPGETEEDFEQLLNFITEARFDRAACFAFSAQAGTVAASLPNPVPPEVAAERVDRFMEAQEGLSLDRNRHFEGQRLRVLLEHQDARSREWVGRSYRDAPEVDGQVLLTAGPTNQTPEPGQFVWAVIEEALVHDLRGRIA